MIYRAMGRDFAASDAAILYARMKVFELGLSSCKVFRFRPGEAPLFFTEVFYCQV